MEIGPLLALLAAMSFALNLVAVRRGIYLGGKSSTATAVSVFTGALLYLLILPITGDYKLLGSVSWQAIALLAIAGIINFCLSRLLFFNCVQLIGANRSTTLTQTNIIFAAFFGIVFFAEKITLTLVLGSLGIMLGATLVNLLKEEGAYKFQSSGALLAVIASFCGATSSLLVKSAMKEVSSPYLATAISYAAAAVVWTIILAVNQPQRVGILTLNRPALQMFMLTGVFAMTGHLFRYAALAQSPVSVIQPLMGTGVLFTFSLSFLLNRKIDVFNWRVFTGIVMVIISIFLIFI
jgi:drug/metabolite transporter (DMT)-like permease